MSEHMSPIPSMIYNAAVGGHVTNSQQIIDENLNREQNDINQETVGAVPYNSTTPNGMGRIVLKKTDNFKQVVEAQTNGNTIFVIKYDFTLTGNVTIPANCVLEFEGGSISAGSGQNMDTITGSNTGINAGLVKIFGTNVTLAGSWNVDKGYLEWFDDNNDVAFDKLLSIKANIQLLSKTYSFNQQHILLDGATVRGTGYSPTFRYSGTTIFLDIQGKVVIEDLTIYDPYPYAGSVATTEPLIKISRKTANNNPSYSILNNIRVGFKNISRVREAGAEPIWTKGIMLESSNGSDGFCFINMTNIVVVEADIAFYVKCDVTNGSVGWITSNKIINGLSFGCEKALKIETTGNALVADNKFDIKIQHEQEAKSELYDITPNNWNISGNEVGGYVWDLPTDISSGKARISGIGINQYFNGLPSAGFYTSDSTDLVLLGCVTAQSQRNISLMIISKDGYRYFQLQCIFSTLNVTLHRTFGNGMNVDLYYKVLDDTMYLYCQTSSSYDHSVLNFDNRGFVSYCNVVSEDINNLTHIGVASIETAFMPLKINENNYISCEKDAFTSSVKDLTGANSKLRIYRGQSSYIGNDLNNLISATAGPVFVYENNTILYLTKDGDIFLDRLDTSSGEWRPWLRLNTQIAWPNNGIQRRPVGIGCSIYDRQKKHFVLWDGEEYIYPNGELESAATSGTFANKPTPRNIGFCYFCTSGASIDGGATEKTNIPIYYTRSGWVDANGTTVVAKS